MSNRHAPRGRIKARDGDPLEPPDPMEGICTAKSKQAQRRCRKPAIPGGTVCRMHGGAAPQVKLAAMQRLEAFQHKAIDRLMQLAEQKEYPSTAFAAVRDVLDRTMGKPSERVELTGAGGKPLEVRWKD
jgi:hypothetical protein